MSYWAIGIIIFIFIYILANIALYFLQERFIFKAEKLPSNFKFDYENQIFDDHGKVDVPEHAETDIKKQKCKNGKKPSPTTFRKRKRKQNV